MGIPPILSKMLDTKIPVPIPSTYFHKTKQTFTYENKQIFKLYVYYYIILFIFI